jgi:hypothetical protein
LPRKPLVARNLWRVLESFLVLNCLDSRGLL